MWQPIYTLWGLLLVWSFLFMSLSGTNVVFFAGCKKFANEKGCPGCNSLWYKIVGYGVCECAKILIMLAERLFFRPKQIKMQINVYLCIR